MSQIHMLVSSASAADDITQVWRRHRGTVTPCDTRTREVHWAHRGWTRHQKNPLRLRVASLACRVSSVQHVSHTSPHIARGLPGIAYIDNTGVNADNSPPYVLYLPPFKVLSLYFIKLKAETDTKEDTTLALHAVLSKHINSLRYRCMKCLHHVTILC